MSESGQSHHGEGVRQAKSPLIIGVGASASAKDSFERFLSKLSVPVDQSIVLVLQHREALDESWLQSQLQRLDGVRLVELTDGAPIEGGAIYLSPVNMIMTVHGDKFAVRQAEQVPGERATIDSFLISLAEERAEQSIGIVLAGTGGDGTLGVATLKDHGGLAIAEGDASQDTRRPDGSTAATIADFVLPPEDIAEHIRIYARHLRRLQERQGFDESLAAVSTSLAHIADILRNKTGNDFHGYKQNTFLRRVQRRVQVAQLADITGYVEFLRNDKDEVQHLLNDLLIGVTEFFRDKREFELLESAVIPNLFEGKQAGQQVRVWVLGCATGEEAYSIAILLRECMAKLDSVPQVQILATDIDGRALAAARVGRYRTGIENDMSKERLARWFVREGDTYCVVKELREMCIFSQHNVIKDAPFSKLDLVSCRNLLIYLNSELQNRVIALFHFALLPGRFLFLGNSENVTRHPKLFTPVDRSARIFKRLETGIPLPPEFPITTTAGRSPVETPTIRNLGSDIGLERRAQRVAERYAPAYIITDDNFQILHFSGRTGRYLEPTAGTATLDLLSLVHRDLRLQLRTTLRHAQETNEPTYAEQVTLGVNGHTVVVDVTVEPIAGVVDDNRNFVVLFKDGPVREASRQASEGDALVRSEHVKGIEGELRATRERLQATIEELESTNEELKSSNEEYQSLNEELQSANEELETLRGELQSVNEKLTTVNVDVAAIARAEQRQRLLLGELRHRVRTTLGVVRSIARRSAQTSSTVEEYAAHLDGRLNAFARTQALIIRDPEAGVDLEYLVVEELSAYDAREGEQVQINGPAVRLRPKSAESFALAIHELATNALKYGALSAPSGRIDVNWRIDEGKDAPALIFEWRERDGPPVSPPQRNGFGTEMLERTFAFEFKGNTALAYDPTGVHCTIKIPLSRRIFLSPLKR